MKIKWKQKQVSECLSRLPKKKGLPKKQYKESGKFPVIDQGQDFIAGFVDDEDLVYKEKLPVIVFGDHTRALKYVDFPFAAGADGTQVLKPIDDLEPRFFYHALKSLHIEPRGYARHFKSLKEKNIFVPSLEEQKKTVAKLEKLLAKVNEAKKLRTEAQEAISQLLPAELHKIFEEGKKKGWEEKELEGIAKSVADGTHDTPRYQDDGFPLVTSKNLRPEGLTFDTAKFISESDYKEINKRSRVSNGDILIGMIGTIGNVTRVNTDKKFSIKNVGLIRPDEKQVLGQYITYYLDNSRLKSLVVTGGTTQKFMALGTLRKIKVIYPPLSEQKKIVARLDSISEKTRKLQEYQKSTSDELGALEQSILSKAFSGEFV